MGEGPAAGGGVGGPTPGDLGLAISLWLGSPTFPVKWGHKSQLPGAGGGYGGERGGSRAPRSPPAARPGPTRGVCPGLGVVRWWRQEHLRPPSEAGVWVSRVCGEGRDRGGDPRRGVMCVKEKKACKGRPRGRGRREREVCTGRPHPARPQTPPGSPGGLDAGDPRAELGRRPHPHRAPAAGGAKSTARAEQEARRPRRGRGQSSGTPGGRRYCSHGPRPSRPGAPPPPRTCRARPAARRPPPWSPEPRYLRPRTRPAAPTPGWPPPWPARNRTGPAT